MKVSFVRFHHPIVLSWALIDACMDVIHSVSFVNGEACVEVDAFPEFLRAAYLAYARLSRDSNGWAISFPLHVSVTIEDRIYRVKVYVDHELKGIRYGSEC